MGIRFQCHHCGHPLHVKDFQAGRKGRCPECKGQFRIPQSDAQFSLDPKANQNTADSAITSTAASSASSASTLATSSIATADAVTQRASSQRTTTNHRSSSAQSTSSSDNDSLHNDSLHNDSLHNDSLRNAVLSNHSLFEQDSLPEPKIDSLDSAATESIEDAHASLSPVEDAQQFQQRDDGLNQPKVIAEAPAATWYVRPAAGGQYGPAPTEIMWQWLVEGRVGVDSLVWRDDWPEWHPANQVFAEFFDKMLGGSVSSASVSNQSAFASPTQTGYANSGSSEPAYQEPQPSNLVSHPSNLGSQPSLRVATHPIVTIDSPQPAAGAATVVTKREARKRSRRVKYSAAIAILVMLLLGLGVGLVIVLYKQGVTQ
jgi:phage FluMu protein Com